MMPATPAEVVYQDFLRFMGWGDYKVLGRQPDDYIYLNFVLYVIRKMNNDAGEGEGK